MKLKFNGGCGALLCDHCGVVIVTGRNIPDEAYEGRDEETYYFCSASCANKWHKELDKRIKVLTPETGDRSSS